MSVESPIPTQTSRIDRLFQLSEQRRLESVPVTWNSLEGLLEMFETPSNDRFAHVLFPDVLLDIRLSKLSGADEDISIAFKNGESPVEHTRALSEQEMTKVHSILDTLQVSAPALPQQ